ncbi:MAG: pyridoxal-phosphate dependent enzyme, partial [Deltaproteobacteria bacterium]
MRPRGGRRTGLARRAPPSRALDLLLGPGSKRDHCFHRGAPRRSGCGDGRSAGRNRRDSAGVGDVILDSLTQAVGNTPLVRLPSLEPPGVEIHAKLEWFNPGGSVKDRAALRMVQEALPILRGRTLLDSTSGNTGIAYAWIGAALKIPVALVMPENVSEARKRIARHFGARIIFSDPLEQSDGAIRLARQLAEEEPERWFYIDQYSNEANPRAHEAGTAPEIWEQTEGRVTHAVIGIGT